MFQNVEDILKYFLDGNIIHKIHMYTRIIFSFFHLCRLRKCNDKPPDNILFYVVQTHYYVKC